MRLTTKLNSSDIEELILVGVLGVLGGLGLPALGVLAILSIHAADPVAAIWVGIPLGLTTLVLAIITATFVASVYSDTLTPVTRQRNANKIWAYHAAVRATGPDLTPSQALDEAAAWSRVRTMTKRRKLTLIRAGYTTATYRTARALRIHDLEVIAALQPSGR